jgi:3-dehydroquinate dehydratase II
MSEPRILCLSGPNLHLLGTREPAVYGRETLADIHERLEARAAELGARIESRQTNHEGTLVDWLGECPGAFDGVLLNPGAYTHTSVAIYDAVKAIGLPCVEVHVTNPDAREPFRRHSYIAAACIGRIAGFGGTSYLLALEGIVVHLAKSDAT